MWSAAAATVSVSRTGARRRYGSQAPDPACGPGIGLLTGNSAMKHKSPSMGGSSQRPAKIGPLTRKLMGVVKLPPGKTYQDVLTEALMEKYRPRK